jgi:hypothetical protein
MNLVDVKLTPLFSSQREAVHKRWTLDGARLLITVIIVIFCRVRTDGDLFQVIFFLKSLAINNYSASFLARVLAL